MTYQEQIEKIIETHNLAPEANIADFVDNLVREVEYLKRQRVSAVQALDTANRRVRSTLLAFTEQLLKEWTLQQYWDGEPCERATDPVLLVDKYLSRATP